MTTITAQDEALGVIQEFLLGIRDQREQRQYVPTIDASSDDADRLRAAYGVGYWLGIECDAQRRQTPDPQMLSDMRACLSILWARTLEMAPARDAVGSGSAGG